MDGKLEKELQKGAEAQQLVDGPIFKEVMDAIEKDLDDAMLSIDTTDMEICTDVIRRRQLFESIKGKFSQFINDGKMAKFDIEAENEVKEPKFER